MATRTAKKKPSPADEKNPLSDVSNGLHDLIFAKARNRVAEASPDKAAARKRFDNRPSIRRVGETASKRWPEEDIVRTGSEALDLAIGIGGVPKGHLTVMYGPYSSGKSQLALHAAANASQDSIVIYLDAEGTLDDKLILSLGANQDNLMIYRPNSIEELTADMLNSKDGIIPRFGDNIGMIVLDSIPALSSKAEMDAAEDENKQTQRARAKAYSDMLAVLMPKISAFNIALVAVNQIRQGPADFRGRATEKRPGGEAWDFYASVLIRTARGQEYSEISTGEGLKNHQTKFKLPKNKVAVPHKQAEVTFAPGKRYPFARDVWQTALDSKFYDVFSARLLLKNTGLDDDGTPVSKKGFHTVILAPRSTLRAAFEADVNGYPEKLAELIKVRAAGNPDKEIKPWSADQLQKALDQVAERAEKRMKRYRTSLDRGYHTVRGENAFIESVTLMTRSAEVISDEMRNHLDDVVADTSTGGDGISTYYDEDLKSITRDIGVNNSQYDEEEPVEEDEYEDVEEGEAVYVG